jgi:hypothetical protein
MTKRTTEPTVTVEAKHAIAMAFEGAGGLRKLINWARTHPEAFYTQMYTKLIPLCRCAGRSKARAAGHVGRQLQGAVELSGLQAVRWEAGRLFGRLKPPRQAAHLDEIIGCRPYSSYACGTGVSNYPTPLDAPPDDVPTCIGGVLGFTFRAREGGL